eukprot:6212647-Pleurochrysis_carterae.AAC.3
MIAIYKNHVSWHAIVFAVCVPLLSLTVAKRMNQLDQGSRPIFSLCLCMLSVSSQRPFSILSLTSDWSHLEIRDKQRRLEKKKHGNVVKCTASALLRPIPCLLFSKIVAIEASHLPHIPGTLQGALESNAGPTYSDLCDVRCICHLSADDTPQSLNNHATTHV